PAAAAAHPAAPPMPAAAPALPAPGRNDWRVVVYTYTRQPDAEKRAQSLARKWPAFHPEVFTPNGPGRGPYLVSIGGRMTRKEALRLQKQARAKGLPRDTFARNYER
ncbi:MAG TPA: SPOR domain-containing protein, partial [Bryobacteraceae bacterium]|nr:SPOR domain-containing protein [Bryobacteraceae bacterium]